MAFGQARFENLTGTRPTIFGFRSSRFWNFEIPTSIPASHRSGFKSVRSNRCRESSRAGQTGFNKNSPGRNTVKSGLKSCDPLKIRSDRFLIWGWFLSVTVSSNADWWKPRGSCAAFGKTAAHRYSLYWNFQRSSHSWSTAMVECECRRLSGFEKDDAGCLHCSYIWVSCAKSILSLLSYCHMTA